jgi:two-component system, chemotaxis family, protein-glutamate methylesterase/glutaminase
MARVSSAIGLGASAGGLRAYEQLVAELPRDFSNPIFLVLHIGAKASNFPDLLASKTKLPCRYARDGEEVMGGHIYAAPPDYHMVVDRGLVLLTKGPRENWSRPSIDVLFRSLASEYGAQAIGVVLTGNLNDGTAGLYEIKRHGGSAIVQDPAEAESPSMPKSALNNVSIDHCLSLKAAPPSARIAHASKTGSQLSGHTGCRPKAVANSAASAQQHFRSALGFR